MSCRDFECWTLFYHAKTTLMVGTQQAQSSGKWIYLVQSSEKILKNFTVTKLSFSFNCLLHGLDLEVKDSKIFYILQTSLVHPDPEKSLWAIQKQKSFKFLKLFQTSYTFLKKSMFWIYLKEPSNFLKTDFWVPLKVFYVYLKNKFLIISYICARKLKLLISNLI